ncbi:MAG: DUF3179 domain-containing (seleno)protein [Pirellulales bacterium]
MRLRSSLTVMLLILIAGRASAQQAAETTEPSTIRELFKPEAFQTLVNPDCSHCVDEAKARAGDLKDSDRVLAWTRGQYEGGAIPLRFFLVPYRVISDTYGVFVYDADAGFVRGFEPSLDFSFHGWRNGVMVMRHKDGTLYSTLSGRAFAGPRRGDQLKPVATIATDWGFWNKAYPGSVAYRMFEKYQPIEVPDGPHPDSLATRGPSDPRLKPETEVIGVELGGQAKAWPIEALQRAGGLIRDKLGDQPVVVLWYKPTRTAAVYSTALENSDQPATVNLSYDPSSARAPFVDRETGSRWGIEGRAADGPLEGKTLRWLPGVQCRWFAWSAEYPDTALHAAAKADSPAGEAAGKKPGRQRSPPRRASKSPLSQPPAAGPFEAVIVDAAALTPRAARGWRDEGYRAVVVALDERYSLADYRSAAATAKQAGLDLYYWIEVARNQPLAEAHPEWMASLGLHEDWHERYPDVPLPAKGQVAKVFPWVPIGYREAFDAHRARVARLVERAAGDYRGLLLNDLQGGPASCGCGNLQCRWAIDYGVPSTGTRLEGDDVAARFIAEVQKLVPGREVVPIWTTECEDRDLPASLAPGAKTTGHCGSVPCSRGTCPKAFTQQFSALAAAHQGPIGILATHKELKRDGPQYGGPAGWVPQALDYLDQVLPGHGGQAIDRGRLWLVVQGYDLSGDERQAARRAALGSAAAAVLVALTPIDQSYEPRLIDVDGS